MSSETCERDTLRTILCYLHIAKKSCREDNVLRSIQLAENTAQSRLTRLTDREREAQSPSQSPRLTHSATLSSARGSPRSTSGIRSQSSSTLTKGVPNQKKIITRKPPTPRSPQQGAAGSTRSRSSNLLSQPTASSARRTVAAQRAPVTAPDIRAQHVRSPLSSTPFSDPFAEDGRTVTSVMIGGRLVQMGGGPPVPSPERTRTPRKLQRSTSNTVSSVSMKRETRSTNAGMGSFARASIDRKSPRGQRILEQLQRQTSQSGTSPSKPKKTTHQDELAQPVDASDKSSSHVQEKERDVGSKGSGILSPPQSSDPEKRKGDDGRVDNAGEVAKSWSTGSCNLEDIWDEI